MSGTNSSIISPKSVLAGDLRFRFQRKTQTFLTLTGLVFFQWLARYALDFLFAFRQPTLLHVSSSSVELRGERRIFGVSFGTIQRRYPRTMLKKIELVGNSPWVSIGCMVVTVILGVGIGSLLIIWGILGSSPTWIGLGFMGLGLGWLMEATAYLGIQRAIRQNRGSLELLIGGDRIFLRKISRTKAIQLIGALTEEPSSPDRQNRKGRAMKKTARKSPGGKKKSRKR